MGSKKKKQKIGYEYYLGMLLIGPLSQGFVKLWGIVAGDRSLGVTDITDDARIYIDKPNLFGGDEGEGGVRGWVDFQTGKPTQGANKYLQSQLGQDIPAWRNVISFVLNKCLVTMLSPYVKAWAFDLEFQRSDWYTEKQKIGANGSTNAIHVIHHTLTAPHAIGCLELPIAGINDANFRAAADVLYNEGFGISIKRAKSMPAKEFIDLVMQHVNGIFYENEVTGLFEIKLLRSASTEGLPQLNNANSKHVSFQRALPSEMANKITVTYSPLASGKDQAVSAVNHASVSRQGRVIPETVNLPGLDTQYTAQMIANTLLKQKCTPLAKITRTVKKSTAINFSYGDLVEVNDPDHNIEKMVCRVLKMDMGDVSSANAQVDLCEDIFALDKTIMIGDQPDEWVDPLKPPVPTDQDCSFELPYYVAAKYYPEQLVDLATDDGLLLGCVGKDTQTLLSVKIWEKLGPSAFEMRSELSPCPVFVVGSDVNKTDTLIPVSFWRGQTSGLIGTFANIGEECVQIAAIDDSGLTVVRGVIDTIPGTIKSGVRGFCVENNLEVGSAATPIDSVVTYRLAPVSPIGELRIEDAVDLYKTIKGRHADPYPPANVTINGKLWPVSATGKLIVAWSHRNRSTQADTLVGWYDASVTKDPDTTYTIRVIDTKTGEVLIYADKITGDSWTGTPQGEYITIELMAVYPNGRTSRMYTHNFIYTPPVMVELILKPNATPPAGDNISLKLGK